MCAKHYENPTMLSRVTAKNVGDVFFETHCITNYFLFFYFSFYFSYFLILKCRWHSPTALPTSSSYVNVF